MNRPGPTGAGRPARRPRIAAGRAAALALLLAAAGAMPAPQHALAQQAQGTSSGAAGLSREELERKLQDRDRVIMDLVNRVEELERRLGGNAAPVAAPPTGVAPAGASPAAAPPQAVAAPRPASAPRAARAPAPAPPGAAPSAAPGYVAVDPAAAERALERTLVETGVLLLPKGQAEITPSIGYSYEEIGPSLLFDGAGRAVADDRLRRDTLSASLGARIGLPFDAQLELGLPYRYVSDSDAIRLAAGRIEDNRDGSGLGDLSIGLAKTLLRESGWIPDLVGRVTWDTATGKRADGGVLLGGGFDELRVGLSASKRQDPLVFALSGSYQWAFEKIGIKPGDEAGISLGAFLALSPETSMRFLFDQVFVDDLRVDGKTVPGSDATLGTLEIGASTILGPGTLLDVAASVGVTDDAPDFAVRVALPIRFALPVWGD